MNPLFITGPGTDIGKTVASAVLVEKLKADYWKPVQSGDLDNTDTDKVRKLVQNPISVFHKESYRLTQPYSPHKSAELDGNRIKSENIVLPQTTNRLLVEGAGGLMVPLNEEFYIIDLIQKINAEVVFVIKHYLGSINHTILSLDALKARNIRIKGLIINGERDSYSERAISSYTDCKMLGYIPHIENLNPGNIASAGDNISISFL